MKSICFPRSLAFLAGGAALALPVGAAAAAAPGSTAVAGRGARSVKLVGKTVPAHQWGTVTVVVTQQTAVAGKKVKRRFTDLGGGYTFHTARTKLIMSQALPILRQEFLTAQSARIQLVSGATYTSEAFIQSLQSALLKAQA
jgi:hypothetical protein